ncbi:MAG: amylo-alpha-1,6-glucosidase, partial [Armatimonadia bacterium]|nr:amylo-alpha-1,6-glucosidase [Armatimonadia bacterium]
VEVQGYRVAAMRAAADLSEAMGDADEAFALRQAADDLVRSIDAAFWDEDLGTFCMALDGDKRRLRVSASNAGHLLYCDAVLPERRDRLIETLAAPALRSGWGIRTLSADSVRYNPMGYHTGSVWPHDTGIVAAGIARAGRPDLAAEFTDELFAASRFFPENRLPELWCGFPRGQSVRPVPFPSACSPQAWSAGAPFMCLQACLGLSFEAPAGILHVANGVLPPGVDRLVIRDLRVGHGRVHLRFVRAPDGEARLDSAEGDPDAGIAVMPNAH